MCGSEMKAKDFKAECSPPIRLPAREPDREYLLMALGIIMVQSTDTWHFLREHLFLRKRSMRKKPDLCVKNMG